MLAVHLLTRGTMTQALIFTRTKHRANRLADFLVRSGIKTERIHGNRSQAQRTAALAGFRNGTYPVLVATDIAARGIDVEALGHVVNFDVPLAPDDYIHRVGRTGPRRDERGSVHVRVASGRGRAQGHRARARTPAAARDGTGLRLRRAAAGQAGDSAGAAHRGNPGAKARRARTRGRERGAALGSAARATRDAVTARRRRRRSSPATAVGPRRAPAPVRRARSATTVAALPRPLVRKLASRPSIPTEGSRLI